MGNAQRVRGCVQVAGQQGAYIARVINRNVNLGTGGLDEEPPYKTVESNKAREFDNEFEFLSLGIMAYIGRERAVMQACAPPFPQNMLRCIQSNRCPRCRYSGPCF